MSKQLEELRAQRDLIKKHLDWLDAQIQQAEGSSTAALAPSIKPIDKSAETLTSTPADTIHLNVPEVEETTAPLYEINEEHHLAHRTSDIKRAQIGCVLFFAVGTLLFLFLLFGLPNLID